MPNHEPKPTAPTSLSAGPLEADKDRYIEIWKKTVETQMHFNEMSGKSRQLGLTFVAASLGVAVVMLARGDDFAIALGTWKVHVGVLLILAGLLALRGVRDLDLNVYHRMLRGAVTFGEDFERVYLKSIFDLEKGMTQAISHFSRFDDAKIESDQSRYKYLGEKKVTAEDKIRRFYSFCTWFLAIAAICLFLSSNFQQITSLINRFHSSFTTESILSNHATENFNSGAPSGAQSETVGDQ